MALHTPPPVGSPKHGPLTPDSHLLFAHHHLPSNAVFSLQGPRPRAVIFHSPDPTGRQAPRSSSKHPLQNILSQGASHSSRRNARASRSPLRPEMERTFRAGQEDHIFPVTLRRLYPMQEGPQALPAASALSPALEHPRPVPSRMLCTAPTWSRPCTGRLLRTTFSGRPSPCKVQLLTLLSSCPFRCTPAAHL